MLGSSGNLKDGVGSGDHGMRIGAVSIQDVVCGQGEGCTCMHASTERVVLRLSSNIIMYSC